MKPRFIDVRLLKKIIFYRITAAILSGIKLLLAALVIWFNPYYYPGHGINCLAQTKYREALLRVGAGFAASESLKLTSLLYSKFRQPKKIKPAPWEPLCFKPPTAKKSICGRL